MDPFISMIKYMYTMRFNYRTLTLIFVMKHINYIQVTANYRWYKFISARSSPCPSIYMFTD